LIFFGNFSKSGEIASPPIEYFVVSRRLRRAGWGGFVILPGFPGRPKLVFDLGIFRVAMDAAGDARSCPG
jgi:hypothetical protein